MAVGIREPERRSHHHGPSIPFSVSTTAARAKHIQVTAITETPAPGSLTFQAWQSAQLRALEGALARATGR